jgi:hypothetical protein
MRRVVSFGWNSSLTTSMPSLPLARSLFRPKIASVFLSSAGLRGGNEKKIKLKGSANGLMFGFETDLFKGTTTLLQAAEAADDNRDEYVALITELGCQNRKVQDLLDGDELYKVLLEQAADLSSKATLASFRIHCRRESQPPQSVSAVAALEKGFFSFFFFFSCCSSCLLLKPFY